MKSRYESLVKLKKKALEKAEQMLMNANSDVTANDAALISAYNELSSLVSPKNGPISEFFQAQLMVQAQYREIEECRAQVERARVSQQAAREAFSLSRIEFEKFNYLEVQEIESMIAKVKYEEAKMLDEIGTMMYKKSSV
ncbi:MAG: flagellar FliJ family protein [Sulfuricurvum sp.]|nr:flagellar FliJ family protein [Sulfuricurvum sp.]